MSLRGQLNNISGDFFTALKGAALKGNIDPQGGLYGTRKIVGYVCNVHPIDDDTDELSGTVDVQEYESNPEEYNYEGVGLHKGVLCSAIQNNKSGIYLMPTKYSDVVIVQDPTSLEEYVLMYSHVDVMQLQSHSSVSIGVTETEPFNETDEDAPDYDELAETGNASKSTYDKEQIVHSVKSTKGELTITQTADKVTINAKNSTITIDTEGKVKIEASDVNISSRNNLSTTCPNTTIDGSQVEVTGASFVRKGIANVDGQGGFCGIPVCPFTGAIHTGSTIAGG